VAAISGWLRRSSRERAAAGESLRLVFTLVGREVRDTLRDWRMVVPILILTLFFPALMSGVANAALNWVNKYGGAPIIGERMIPFLLMVVGFFPISFSLVIALETFVGEKERKSLEPLLATPLTDAQLYLGKTLAAMIPSLLASYLGITVYLLGLYIFEGWSSPLVLLVLVVLLTTAEGLVMVTGAVVISSQTTSVRAANLLASFIIIPMALLIQGEAIIMFWANYRVLWWILLFLVVVDVVLVRMGIHTFNREELLGREIDVLNLASLWRTFRGHLRWEPWLFGLDLKKMPAWLHWLGTMGGLYRREIPAILRRSRLALMAVTVGLVFSAYIGYTFATRYPFPMEMAQHEDLSAESFAQSQNLGMLSLTTWGVLIHNVRVLVAAALLAVFSFGTLAIALLMVPLAVVFFLVLQAMHLGYNPVLFFVAAVLPHGVLELPAAVIATALAVRMGAVFMSPSRGMTVGEGWLWALADFVKVFLALVLPLLALAAALEVHVTPRVVLWVLGG
jgi:uncharacterized membrane protein SpoIIM required for sporulation/ABC-type transport system involved in multi-copper enzyme maturation permease subunit